MQLTAISYQLSAVGEMRPGLGLLAAYALGSIPFAYLTGKSRGIDLRQHGSGNLGATNVARILGKRIGIMVFVLDTAKGFLAAFILPRALGVPPDGVWAIAYGVAAIGGHVRPVFMGFQRGGKGVATAGGVFFGLAPVPTLAALVVWALVFFMTGYVSLASLFAAVALPLAIPIWMGTARAPLFYAAVVLGAFVFWTHRHNIVRLRRGKEHRFEIARPRFLRSLPKSRRSRAR